MRYTCIKKKYPQFSKDCKECPEYNPCAKGGK
nr:MAG TPA: transposase DDE domain protein [Caudoviricetes sp.]